MLKKEEKEKKKKQTNIKKNDRKNSKDIFGTFSGRVLGSVRSVHFRIVLWSSLYFSKSQAPSYVVSTNDRVLIYCTCYFQGSSLCFSFFCLLVSSVSDFRPDTREAEVDTFFLCSLFHSLCGEGRMLQTNNTGVCSQCLSHAGPAPTHGAHCSGSMLLHQGSSEVGPGLHAPPWSKPLRLMH